MVSFLPLKRTLSERGIGLSELSVGIGTANSTLWSEICSSNLSTEKVYKICQFLHCTPGQVFECVSSNNEKYSVNWDRLKEMAGSLYTLSKDIGCAKNCLVSYRARGTKVSGLYIEKICRVLDCQPSDFTEEV